MAVRVAPLIKAPPGVIEGDGNLDSGSVILFFTVLHQASPLFRVTGK